MHPFDMAWQLLKNYTKPSPVMLPELGETDIQRNPPISQHLKDNNEHYRKVRQPYVADNEKHDFDNQRNKLLLANMFNTEPPYARPNLPPPAGMGELRQEDLYRYYSDND